MKLVKAFIHHVRSAAVVEALVEDRDVDAVTSIIRTVAGVGRHFSGYVYVSPVEQVLLIGGAA